MTTTNLRPDFAGPSCQVQAGVGPTFSANNGFTSVIRNGPGDYTLTLQDQLDPDGSVVLASATGGNPVSMSASVTLGPPSTIQVKTLDGAAGVGLGLPIEASFGIQITRA